MRFLSKEIIRLILLDNSKTVQEIPKITAIYYFSPKYVTIGYIYTTRAISAVAELLVNLYARRLLCLTHKWALHYMHYEL